MIEGYQSLLWMGERPKQDNKLKYNIWISGFGSRVTRLIL